MREMRARPGDVSRGCLRVGEDHRLHNRGGTLGLTEAVAQDSSQLCVDLNPCRRVPDRLLQERNRLGKIAAGGMAAAELLF